jgi:hypothetical protein
MVAKIESVIIKRPQDALIGPQNLANLWQAFNYTACPDYEKTLLEFAHFEQVLKQHVAKIYSTCSPWRRAFVCIRPVTLQPWQK